MRERERKRVGGGGRGNNNGLSHVPSNRKEEIKSGTYGCGSFVVPYFQLATSADRLHTYIYIYIERERERNIYI